MEKKDDLLSVNEFWLKLKEKGVSRSIAAIYTDCRTGFIKSKKEVVGGRPKTLILESEIKKYITTG